MWPPEELASRLYDWANVGLIVGLVLGVVSTFLLVWMGNVKESYLRQQVGKNLAVAALAQKDATGANLKIAELGKEAAEAKLRAEGFERDIATANQRASEADARAAEANLQLTKLKTPRTINAEQRKRIADKLLAFPGIECDLAIYNDPEAQALLPQIEETLKAGGWTQVHWIGGDVVLTRTGHPVVGLVSLNGVVVQMHPDHVKEFWEAAKELVSALRAEGIEAVAQSGLGVANTKPTAMHIMIGKKPQ